MSHPAPKQPEFMSIMLAEMGVRMGMALVAMVLSFAGAALIGGLGGALVGLGVGVVLYALVVRRFNARPKPAPGGPSS